MPAQPTVSKRRPPLMPLYFAYGSNLLSARLSARCPSARFICVARAQGWGLTFTKPGRDNSGKAGLIMSETSAQAGVVYDLATEEVPVLDRFEGLGNGYSRDDTFIVNTEDGTALQTFTYIPTTYIDGLIPHDWYLALCIAGAQEHKLPDEVLQQFRQTPSNQHENNSDHGREAGIDALKAAGHDNWQSLLS